MKGLCCIVLLTSIAITVLSNPTSDVVTLRDGSKLNGSNIVKFKDKTYYFLTTYLGNWYQAFQHCKEIGTRLLTIHSQEENDFLQTFLRKSGWTDALGFIFWTSATNFGDNARYIWFSTGEPVNYTYWSPGEPDNAGGIENCIDIANRGTDDTLMWNDNQCVATLYVICEVKDKEC